ncbi:BlaI/MecI/CopY family transcriptional regulator [Heliorestis convoluta]|uniref:Transcriptional repressor, CopY family n=1 Tax=Heliorestis convoluta TaxID=356322 RepID=A0A5Q2N557_9FIRM|nr:BlaI/MecI/CopY family transcriptional regulator [Heliorestis convoluta]QGG47715.1 transcriptional repressor, CopY family [Heliorestis convoluta]
MKKIQRMSDAEKQIMEFIWSVKGPVTTKDIIGNLPEGKTWKKNTVITFLSRLTDKGILTATKIGKAHHYEPCLTEEEYKLFETKQFIQDVHKGSLVGFLSTLCGSGDLTKEDIEELRKKLKE